MMLSNLIFNELRDVKKALSQIDRSTTKQLYNQLKVAEANKVETMKNVFYDLFEDEDKVDQRTNAKFEGDHYTIEQNIELFSENGFKISENLDIERVKVHKSGSLYCIYYEESGETTAHFVQDSNILYTHLFEGVSPHVNSFNGNFYIIFNSSQTNNRVECWQFDQFGESTRRLNLTVTGILEAFVMFDESGEVTPFYLYQTSSGYSIRQRRSLTSTITFLTQAEEMSNIQVVSYKDEDYLFYEDMKNGVKQICYFKVESNPDIKRLTEEDKEEKGYSLIVEEDKINVISLCKQNYYFDLLHSTIDPEEEEVTRQFITIANEDIDKVSATVDKSGSFTYYYLIDDELTIQNETGAFKVFEIDDFVPLANVKQELFLLEGEDLQFKNFTHLFIEDDVLYTHSPEEKAAVYSVDITDDEEFSVIDLYIRQDSRNLNIEPLLNHRERGELFLSLELISEEEYDDNIEKRFRIKTPPVQKINLKFELSSNLGQEVGKFLGYGVTFF